MVEGARISLTYYIRRKLQRLANGEPPRTVDLFAGCGGISLGFHKAGARVVAAVEVDPSAAASHQANFANDEYRLFGDITQVTPAQLIHHIKGKMDQRSIVDLVVGGPPCQPFSRIGRAKLRQVAQDPQAHLNDKRVSLYTRFLAVVEELEPIAFVMENVKDIGNFNRRNVAEEVALEADELGYNVQYALLNAAWYGVPQMRERMIIIGIHKSLRSDPVFPSISHQIEIPQGYATSHSEITLKAVAPPHDHYAESVPVSDLLVPAVNAQEAIGDLPRIVDHLDGRTGRGVPRDLGRALPYSASGTTYATAMRNWPGFSTKETVTHNAMRYTPRDYPIFREMEPGDQYPEAIRIAYRRYLAALKELPTVNGVPADDPTYAWWNDEGAWEHHRLWQRIVPPYDPNKYPNKWRKMEPGLPIRTIPAHVGKDTYSHIHYDRDQARMATVRELARLQSFPDGFEFKGSMNDCFRQIGNSVPPLMANAIADNLIGQLLQVAERRQRRRNTQ